MANKKIINDIRAVYRKLFWKGVKPSLLRISKNVERQLFIDGSIPKNEDAEEWFLDPKNKYNCKLIVDDLDEGITAISFYGDEPNDIPEDNTPIVLNDTPEKKVKDQRWNDFRAGFLAAKEHYNTNVATTINKQWVLLADKVVANQYNKHIKNNQ
jgi:hypothetical protein